MWCSPTRLGDHPSKDRMSMKLYPTVNNKRDPYGLAA